MEWLKKSDITDSQFEISVVNNTTEMPVVTDRPIEIVELSKTSVNLSLPIKSCAFGQFLTVNFTISKKLSWGLVDTSAGTKPETLKVLVTARIDEEAPLDTAWKVVRLSLIQFDVGRWDALIAEIENRQENINQVVAKILE